MSDQYKVTGQISLIGKNVFQLILNPNLEPYYYFPSVGQRVGKWYFFLV